MSAIDFLKRMDRRRLAVVSTIVVLFGSGAAVDAAIDRRQSFAVSPNVEAAPLGASSSAWYCALTPSSRQAPQNGTITVANLSGEAVTGTVSVTPVGDQSDNQAVAPSVDVPLGVTPGGRLVLRLGDVVNAPFSAATVRVNGAGVVVEHTMTTPAGTTTAPCAASASPVWYFADGSTADGSTMTLALYNPFPEGAVADLAFVTSEDRQEPAPLQGVVVPPRSLRIIPIADYLKRREYIASRITTRSGRLVVDQLQNGGPEGVEGTALALTSPMTSTEWYVPNGYVADGVTDALNVYNPGESEATVEVRLSPDTSTAPPFTLTVPARGRSSVRLGVQQQVPEGGRYSAVLRSLGGTPLIVSRTTVATDDSGIGSGLSMSAAAPTLSRNWALAVGATTDPASQTVWFFNPNDRPATVTPTALGRDATVLLAPVVIEPGQRMELSIDDPTVTTVSDPSLLFRSTEPIVVGRDITGGTGFQSTVAVPLR